MNETEFVKHIHQEKLKAQEARTTFTLRKLAYATALLSLGSLDADIGQIIGAGPIDLSALLYLAPWAALAFDLYILAEDYSVKRFGEFLKAHSPDPMEKAWENWVSENRDPYAPFAMSALTTLVWLGAVVVIWAGESATLPVFVLWSVLTVSVTWGLFFHYRRLRRRIRRNEG
jgi:hypothetical protein